MNFIKVKLLKKTWKSKSEENPDQENAELIEELKNETCGKEIDENVNGDEIDEEDEDDDDFITNEVKRRLKELRKNSFMVLIPEETCQEEEEHEEEEETSSNEWREAEAEKVFPWFEFDALYNKYCERMLFFDKMSARQLKESGSWNISVPSPRSTTKKLSTTLRNLSLKKQDGFQEEQEQLHQPEEDDPYNNLETAYVAQICLTWETLHCQYMQLCQKMSSGMENSNSHCYAAQAFQQFQVLLQRFIENEPFEQGSRVEIFARTRRSIPMLLQIPNFQGLDQKENAGNNGDSIILAPDLLNIIQDSILAFHRFLKMDKEKSNHVLNLFKGNNNQDASSLHQVQASLSKKETKVKELSKKKWGSGSGDLQNVGSGSGDLQNVGGGSGDQQNSNRRARHQHSQSMDGSSSMNMEQLVGSLAEGKKTNSATDLADLALVDPKRAKRIWANRQSAARSKERKVRYIAELERMVQTLQSEATKLSGQMAMLQRDATVLSAENSELKVRLQAMEQQVHLQDALNETLRNEVQRLKMATGQMKLNYGQSPYGANSQLYQNDCNNNNNYSQAMQSVLTARQLQQLQIHPNNQQQQQQQLPRMRATSAPYNQQPDRSK